MRELHPSIYKLVLLEYACVAHFGAFSFAIGEETGLIPVWTVVCQEFIAFIVLFLKQTKTMLQMPNLAG